MMATNSEQPSNLVLILTDQQRDVGPYESEDMQAFRERELTGFRRLCERGVRFTQHRINSSACAPSRASLLTGYAPWVHGVTQTDGLAKRHDDPAQQWLPARRVPTLGHRFQAAGWESVYFGKWHLSHADIDSGPAESAEDVFGRYQAANVLRDYGFEHWVGPEPHGANVGNTGVFRDGGYIEQAQGFLRERAAQSERPPFLLVVSLVNPHDICFWPAWSLWNPGLLDIDDIGAMGSGATDEHVVRDEPSALVAYRERYYGAYGPRPIIRWVYGRNPERYRRFYCSLLRRADRHIGAVLDTLDETGLAESTHVVCTSDHGELLGAHGALHQKWYNAYEETLRVPLVIAPAQRSELAGTSSSALTTHADMVPTLLGLAGIERTLPDDVSGDFEHTPPLLGQDILAPTDARMSYFVTHDDILSGQTPEASIGRRFPILGAILPLRYPNLGVDNHAVESLVGSVPTHDGSKPSIWKLVRYFNPSNPEHDAQDEWMLFNLSVDPIEAHNVAGDEAAQSVRLMMVEKLCEERRKARQGVVEV